MDKDILLTIIIPVYNVQDYLKECVDSILCQMTEEVECILVDDGSTDLSGELCDRYGQEDSRFYVVHKQNGGLSSARNEGLKFAKGKYITFIDSDDRISKNCIKEIIEWAKNSETDFCFMQIIKFYPNGETEDLGEKIYSKDFIEKNKEEICKALSKKPKYPGSACGKLYRRCFLEQYHLNFPKDKRYSEDLGFIRDCIIQAQKIEALDFPFYEYRQNRVGSITNKKKEKNFFDLTLFVKETVALLEQKDYKNIEKYLLSFVAYEYSILLWMFMRVDFQNKEDATTFLRSYRYVLKHGKARRIKMINLIMKVLGIKNTSKILNLIKR